MAKPIKTTDRDKPWNRSTNPDSRAYRTTEQLERILIVCEGKKTEPTYFQAISKLLRVNYVKVVIKGEGANTLSLLAQARSKRDEAAKTRYPFDQTWVVFDRDSFPGDDFDNAIASARADGIKCAWSNEAFELWYLLHFEDRNAVIGRKDFGKKLSEHLGLKYAKNSEGMYDLLVRNGSQKAAIQRASALEKMWDDRATPPSRSNPCTTVHRLVVELNRFMLKSAIKTTGCAK